MQEFITACQKINLLTGRTMQLKRFIMHRTGGGNSANSIDRKRYHEIVEGDGERE